MVRTYNGYNVLSRMAILASSYHGSIRSTATSTNGSALVLNGMALCPTRLPGSRVVVASGELVLEYHGTMVRARTRVPCCDIT